MQFKSFHWLSHHGILSIIPHFTNVVSVHIILGCFIYFASVFYILGQFNNTIIIITPIALVGYEMIIANLALCTSLALYHLLFNVSLWRNCKVSLPLNEQKPTKANLCFILSSSTCFPVVTFWLSICSSSAFILKKKLHNWYNKPKPKPNSTHIWCGAWELNLAT